MKTNIIAVGDIHLGWNPKFLEAEQHDSIISKVLDEVTQHALASEASMVALLGDVFDNARPTPRSISTLMAWLVRHHKAAPNVMVALPTGNHDREDATRHSLEWLTPLCEGGLLNVMTYDTNKAITHKGVPLIFLPWAQYSETPDPEIEQLLAGDPAIVFAHTEVKGSQMDNGWLADGLDLTNTKHWWVVGHLHTEQLLHKGRVDYPGTPTARHWNHTVDGVRLLTVTHKKGKISKVERDTLSIKQPYYLVECDPPKTYAKRTFYRVRLPVGEPMPDHPQIVSIKRLGDKPTKTKSATVDGTRMASLPAPKNWLIEQLDPRLRKRAKRLIASVKLKPSDEDI